jgi:hypothetical protein
MKWLGPASTLMLSQLMQPKNTLPAMKYFGPYDWLPPNLGGFYCLETMKHALIPLK